MWALYSLFWRHFFIPFTKCVTKGSKHEQYYDGSNQAYVREFLSNACIFKIKNIQKAMCECFKGCMNINEAIGNRPHFWTNIIHAYHALYKNLCLTDYRSVKENNKHISFD